MSLDWRLMNRLDASCHLIKINTIVFNISFFVFNICEILTCIHNKTPAFMQVNP